MSALALSPSGQAYQAELERKLAQAKQQAPATGWLGLRLHGLAAGLPLEQAGEIFRPVPLQRLPQTQPWVLGVAGLRGSLWLVLDWVQMLDLGPAPDSFNPRAPGDEAVEYWVTLNPALGLHLALRAQQLLGLRRQAHAPNPAALPTASAGGRAPSVVAESNQTWTELDASTWLQCVQQQAFMLGPFASALRRPLELAGAGARN